MKSMNKNKISFGKWLLLSTAAVFSLSSCDEYLDRAPLSEVTPDAFLNSEADLSAFTINAYSFPTHGGFSVGIFGNDNHTDNQATANAASRWIPGEYRVAQSGGVWDFGSIRNMNYYLETVLPKWKSNDISGNSTNIEHYIGEGYFLRAYEYFNKLQALGDFPILKRHILNYREKHGALSVLEISDHTPPCPLWKENVFFSKNSVT